MNEAAASPYKSTLYLLKTSKRRRILTQTDLELEVNQIADELAETPSDSDFDSDDSFHDPNWNPDADVAASNQHYSSKEGVIEDDGGIENVILDLAIEENADEQAESDDEATSSNSIWSDYVGWHKPFSFTGPHGVQNDPLAEMSPVDAFFLILDDEVINHIVMETNRFAEQTIASKEVKKYARNRC
ncbi:hypothetical protein NQ318_023567 [Aromia moschata]|uniref:PiggyBac transposable element-derived protein domain-containing protein n=1 Tax=Aromia moschata TaxID=1265417 RepID=A0AAV8YQ26_9CUCU|nr:hypothetical protein NQ318_023567 [Aromia moschata]